MSSTSNNFNTTPDGTTVVDVNSVLNDPTTLILDSTKTPFIDNIFNLNPTITTFVFKPGAYKLVNVFFIRTSGIRLLGMTNNPNDVTITQSSVLDGIVLNANNIVLQGISVICQHSQKVCLTTASINNTVVNNCYFIGSSDTFTIYYAGPSELTAGASTLNAYNDYVLDQGNVFYQNIVYTNYSGDSISFSLQYKGQFVGNVVRGGKIAVYMCRTTNVYDNQVTDSVTNGIYVSLPSDNLSIIGNKIYGSKYSSIKVSNQMEHGAFTPYPYNIVVQCNTIFNSGLYGIELNYVNSVSIRSNTLTSKQSMGVYMYLCTNTVVQNNKIAYFNYGIWLDASNNCAVQNNQIISIYPDKGQNGVKLTSTSTLNTVFGNNLMGRFVYDLIADSGTNDTVETNSVTPSLSYNTEKTIYNVIA